MAKYDSRALPMANGVVAFQHGLEARREVVGAVGLEPRAAVYKGGSEVP